VAVELEEIFQVELEQQDLQALEALAVVVLNQVELQQQVDQA
jgi:hypothetical protein